MKRVSILFAVIFTLAGSLAQAQDKLLVCLHGFMRSTGNFSAFHEEFTSLGWHVFRWDYPSRSKKIKDLSHDFAYVMQEIESRLPNHEVHFVTHSLGGLVLRASMNQPHFPEKYKEAKAILIAPPNQGSSFGRYLGQYKPFRMLVGKKAGKELTSKDDFKHLGQFPLQAKVLVIAGTCGVNPLLKGKNDGKVMTTETRLETPHDYKEVFAGHSWISHAKKTIEFAKEFFLRVD